MLSLDNEEFGGMKRVDGKKKNKFEIEMPAKGFEPAEVKVEVKSGERVLKVSGRHEEKNAEGEVIGIREFSRSCTVPEDYDLEKIESDLRDGGVLRISAPRIAAAIEADKEAKGDDEEKSKKNSDEDGKGSNEDFSVQVDVSGYKPEDLKLEVNDDGVVSLSATHEDKSETGSSSMHFTKSFLVPKDVDLTDIKSHLSKDNILKITAPKKKEALKGNVSIPISMDVE